MHITKLALYSLALVEMILLIAILNQNQDIIDSAQYYSIDGQHYLWTIEEAKGQKLNQDVGKWIRLYRIENGQRYFLYENDFSNVYPWEIDVGDIDRKSVV